MSELTFGNARIELITRDGELWARVERLHEQLQLALEFEHL
ncbi:hypothetical protein [Pseudomonas oleovorans]|nr:hypothetical protein [Pseudomonas oleovorans]